MLALKTRKVKVEKGAKPILPYPFLAKEHQSPIEVLRKEVLKRRPVLKEVLSRCGHKLLLDYTSEYYDVKTGTPERRSEFLSVFKEYTTKLLGEEVASGVTEQLRAHYFVSTADHHGPLMDPYFLNANLVADLTASRVESNLPYVVVLSCAGVSLNNSTFPRGLTFHSFKDGEPVLHRLSFLPSNSHASAIFGFRPFLQSEVQKVRKSMLELLNVGHITKTVHEKLSSIFEDVYGSPDLLECKSYAEQVTKTNARLWKYLFPGEGNGRELVYVDQEGLVVELLLKEHLHKFSIIHSILFDPEARGLFTGYFDGIEAGFSKERHTGTFIFWGINKKNNQRVALWEKNGNLESEDGSISVPFVIEEIETALKNGLLMPSSLLIFLMLSFYYGVKCLGGFCQVNYLTAMKHAYIKMLADLGKYKDVEYSARVQTKEMCEDLSVAFLPKRDGSFLLATGLDIALYGEGSLTETLELVAESLTLNESISLMLPEFYSVLVRAADRDPVLQAIKPEEIATYMELSKKIKGICESVE